MDGGTRDIGPYRLVSATRIPSPTRTAPLAPSSRRLTVRRRTHFPARLTPIARPRYKRLALFVGQDQLGLGASGTRHTPVYDL